MNVRRLSGLAVVALLSLLPCADATTLTQDLSFSRSYDSSSSYNIHFSSGFDPWFFNAFDPTAGELQSVSIVSHTVGHVSVTDANPYSNPSNFAPFLWIRNGFNLGPDNAHSNYLVYQKTSADPDTVAGNSTYTYGMDFDLTSSLQFYGNLDIFQGLGQRRLDLTVDGMHGSYVVHESSSFTTTASVIFNYRVAESGLTAVFFAPVVVLLFLMRRRWSDKGR